MDGAPGRRLAVFDLDGTITRHDTLVPYVAGLLLRRPWRLPRLLLSLPAALSYLLRLSGRGELKSALLRATLGGLPRDVLAAWTGDYLPQVIPARLHRDALDRIAAHRAAGDVLVLMSASPDLYVPTIARQLGFDQAVCTELRWHGDRFHGALVTPNRRGPEKARCLESLRQAYPGLPVVAYGNSSGDVEHLLQCEEGVYVNAGRRASERLRGLGLRVERWR